MKRFLLWVVGVALGVAVLLAAVMAVSYSFTARGFAARRQTRSSAGRRWKCNGSCWQVPLLGGQAG